MDPTQQRIPPPADAPVGGATPDTAAAVPAAVGGLMPPPQAMNPFLNMGATMPPTMPPLPPNAITGASTIAPALNPMLPPAMMNPMMQFPVITDPIILGQLTGFPGELLANSPSMMAGAQQFLAQRMMMQQQNMMYNQAGIAPVQAIITPQQMQIMQQQRLQAQLAKNNAKPAKNSVKRKPKKAKAATAAPAAAADGIGNGAVGADGTTASDPNNTNSTDLNILHTSAPPGALPAVKEDPGGKVLWAKIANNSPWWPAKTLDESKDRSYPPDADPPRPTAIAIRLFGTHEFAWVGSKRALVEWEKGFAQFSKESTEVEKFALALQEAETYLTEQTLPDVFYIIPAAVHQPGAGRRGGVGGGKGRGKRSAGGAAGGGNPSKKYAMTTLGAQETGSGGLNDYPMPGIPDGVGGTIPNTADLMMAAMAPGFGAGHHPNQLQHIYPGGTGTTSTMNNMMTGKSRHSRNGPELSVEERAAIVFSKKKQRLYELGLLAPSNSPFTKGCVAENPVLLEKLQEWEANAPEIMQKAREHVAKPEISHPPRASVYRKPPPQAAAAAVVGQQQQHADHAVTAAALAAMQTQNAAYMMGMMNMPLSLASFL